MTRLAVNYNPAKLWIQTATPGFTLGEGKLGITMLGPDGAYGGDLRPTITGIKIDRLSDVESGLFVYAATNVCTLTSTLTSARGLIGQRLRMNYNTTPGATGTLFQGTIRDASTWDADVGQGIGLPGDTGYLTNRITLRCVGTREAPLNAITPQARGVEKPITRMSAMLGASAQYFVDYPTNDDGGLTLALWYQAYMPAISTSDVPGTGQDVARVYGQISNVAMNFDGTTLAETIWAPGRHPLSLGLTDGSVSTGASYVLGYTSATIERDPAMFCTGVTFNVGGVSYGPWATNAVSVDVRNDVTVNIPGPLVARQAITAQTWMSALPIKNGPSDYVGTVTVPLRDGLGQNGGSPSASQVWLGIQPPQMCLVAFNGTVSPAIVLGVSQTITPTKWLLTITLGPPHLGTRVGDYQPPIASALTASQPLGSGTPLRLDWKNPAWMPAGPVTAVVRVRSSPIIDNGPVPSDATSGGVEVFTTTFDMTGTAGGAAQFASIPYGTVTAGTYAVYVQYTNNASAVGSGLARPSDWWTYPNYVFVTVT